MKKVVKSYDGKILKPNEVLVPFPYDELFARTNITNPDCIGTLTVGHKSFKVMYMPVDKEYEKIARSALNLVENEALGHYTVPNSVSMDTLQDDYDLDISATPSIDEDMAKKEQMNEYLNLSVNLMKKLIEKSPKLGLATLLLIDNVKGKKFQEELKLGHDAANTIRKKAEEYITQGLDNIDIDNINVKKSKNYEYHKERAYQLLDTIIALYLEA